MFNDKDRKFLLWAMPIIMIGGVSLNVVSSAMTSSGIKTGLKYTNTSDEQKGLAQQIVKDDPKAVIDPATGYAFNPRGRKILNEGLIQFEMCGKTLTLKKSIGERVLAANTYCMEKKRVCIVVFSTLRSNTAAGKSSAKRKGIIKQIFSGKAAPGNDNTAHLTGQVFDVLNFSASHECLEKEDFNGGWAGWKNDPHHYYDPKIDIIPVLSGAKAKLRKARNYAWCWSNSGCRRNNITGGGGPQKKGLIARAKDRYHKWRRK